MVSRGVQRLKLAMRKVASHLFLTTLFLTSIFLSFAQAAPGDLDPTFGTGGIVKITSEEKAEINALAIQSDGKIVAVGGGMEFGFLSAIEGMRLMRFDNNGMAASFSSSSLEYEDGPNGIYKAVVIQSDGKIVAAGVGIYNQAGVGYKALILGRYNPDLSLDTSFNSTWVRPGWILTNIGTEASANALVIQPDGKLVAAGYTVSGSQTKFALVRYNTDGTLDAAFGAGGIVTTAIGTVDDEANGLVIQPDGKLVAAGYSYNGSQTKFALVRYNVNGSLDTTFGFGGIVTTPIGVTDFARALVIQPDGKLVAAGYTDSGSQNKFALVRYSTNGNLDSTFGFGGIVTTSIGLNDFARALVIQPDGKLVAAGTTAYPDVYNRFALVRYNTDGTLDAAFGAGGIVTTAVSTSLNGAGANALAIQPDGKLVAAGFSFIPPYNYRTDKAVARYFSAFPGQPPSAYNLTPVNISTLPLVTQSFTAFYSDSDGDISDANLFLSGGTHNESVHYNPATNKFTLMGAVGDCIPGQAVMLSDGNLTLNCSTSNAYLSGTVLVITYNLTPQPSLSGAAYVMIIAATDQEGASNNKTTGFWIVNRQPSANSVTPINSSTPTGTQQTFVSVYSDPDGWQNIAAANFYLSGNGGTHNEWLHYISAANIFFIMGAPGVCSPGQATTLSNGFLTLNCATSTVSGSGTTLTVTFRVTPQAPSSGINYNIFTAASDHAGAAHGLFAGTWGIQ